MRTFVTSIRVAAATILICVVGYPAVILGIAQLFRADSANGSLIAAADGRVVGSRLIAQKFSESRYFWPRPSAVDYNGTGAGGSNKAATSPDLTARAQTLIEQHRATPENPLPPELAAASGGGLDPHISEHAAMYQAQRVADAREIDRSALITLIHAQAFAPGGPLTPDRLVNVLELNLEMDRRFGPLR